MMREGHGQGEEISDCAYPTAGAFRRMAVDLCEAALNDAKSRLHPLNRNMKLDRLGNRPEFVQELKSALEQRVAQKLADSQLGIQAIFKFEEEWMKSQSSWDGSIHLLVQVACVSDLISVWVYNVDQGIVQYFHRSGWSRFSKRESVLDVQQVTSNELRHLTGYGAMFCAVHNVPVKIWPT